MEQFFFIAEIFPELRERTFTFRELGQKKAAALKLPYSLLKKSILPVYAGFEITFLPRAKGDCVGLAEAKNTSIRTSVYATASPYATRRLRLTQRDGFALRNATASPYAARRLRLTQRDGFALRSATASPYAARSGTICTLCELC